MKEKVQAVIEKIRLYLQAHGGDVELIDVLADGTVQVKLHGACDGCPRASITIKNQIEDVLKAEIPEVTSVIQV
jgi:Fe-S cluster biogenesis protein NfuA